MRKNWEDVYYDFEINEQEEIWDEDQQCIVKSWAEDGWDKVKYE